MKALRLYLVVAFIVFTTLQHVYAGEKGSRFELGAGLAAIEEGDDRFRPGAVTHLGFANKYFARLYSYGKKFGPVVERNFLLSAQTRVPMSGVSGVSMALGLCLLAEGTEITYAGDGSQNDKEVNTNFGGALGLHYRIEQVAPIYLELGWDSHIFFAGPSGFIFLANGRKQTISMALGARL